MTQNKHNVLSSENFEFDAVTGEVWYIDETNTKKNITLNAVIIENYKALKSILEPRVNAIYLNLENRLPYFYDGYNWNMATHHSDVHPIISNLNDLVPSILENEDGEYIAPATSLDNIYSENGFNASDLVGNENILRKCMVDSKYVEIEFDGQRVIPIPFPSSDFDFRQSHMSVIIDNRVVEPNTYVINGENLMLSNRYYDMHEGDVILFTFYYTISYNLNDNVILGPNNIKNYSISTEKLDPNIVIKAHNILESSSRIFMTPSERTKLRKLSPINYVHPATHPASMITETSDRHWLTNDHIEYWNAKANKEDVFNKKEVVEKIYNILNTEDLSAFREIAEALGDDPNFATTILTMLSDKISKEDFDKLKAEVDNKVYVNDYVRNTVYDSANKFTSNSIDYYSISLVDDNFAEYVDGMSVTIKVSETNSNMARLRINDLDFKPILNSEQYELIEGELVKDSIYNLRFNAITGNFILQGKGGVKITDSQRDKKIVGDYGDVGRGDPVDINLEDGTINKSRFRIDTLSKLFTTQIYENATDLYVDLIDMNNIFISWFNDNKVYATTLKIVGQYIEYTANNNIIILNDECNGYCIDRVSTDCYFVTTRLGDTISLKTIPIVDCQISMDNSYSDATITCNGEVDNMLLNRSESDRWILAYSHSTITEFSLYKFNKLDKAMELISTRNNTDLPLDKCVRINGNQLLYITNLNKSVLAWVITSDSTDFYTYSSQLLLDSTASEDDLFYKNIQIQSLTDSRALVIYEYDEAKIGKLVKIDENGGISTITVHTYDKFETDLEQKHKSIPEKIYMKNIDSYISASNYDYELDTLNGSGKTIKLMIERESDSGLFYTSSRDNQFLLSENMVLSDISSYKNRVILSYFDETNRLKLVLFDINRKPSGISIGNAEVGEICKYYKF